MKKNNKTTLNSNQIINKFANIDARFTVSSINLAKSLKTIRFN